MGKPSDYPGFKALLKEWNQKLKSLGFKDEETLKYGEYALKHSGSSRRYQRMDAITRDARLQFFRRVAQQVSETKFKNEFDWQILTLYSQGHSQAEIYRMMQLEGHRCQVYRPIYRYLRLWGLK